MNMNLHENAIAYASNLAYAYMVEGRLYQAQGLFEGLCVVDDKGCAYYFRALAAIARMQGKHRKATLLLRRAIKKYPSCRAI